MNGEDRQGLSYEIEIKANGITEHKHDVSLGSMSFALYVQRTGTNLGGKPAKQTSYFQNDHLGSLAVLTNEAGVVIERLAYDPWGKRRNVNGISDPNDTLAGVNTDRGYTMHEHLDEMGVIHMNGRVYDPAIGRFMSADPIIQSPGDLQSFNRFAYVRNNPLNKTDPSGFSWWTKIRGAVVSIVAAFADGMGCGGACSAAVNAYNAVKAKNPIALLTAIVGLPSNPIAAAAVQAGSECVGAMANGRNCGRGAGSALIQSASGDTAVGRIVGGCAASANQGGSCRGGAERALGSMATTYLADGAKEVGNQFYNATNAPPGVTNASYSDPNGIKIAGLGDILEVSGVLPAHLGPLGVFQSAADSAKNNFDSYCVNPLCHLPWIRGTLIHSNFNKNV